jgi:hypothetical protein
MNKAMKGSDYPTEITSWISSEVRNRFGSNASTATPISRLDDFDVDIYEYFIEATIATCRFRPTETDIHGATSAQEMKTFDDLAKALGLLWATRPPFNEEVSWLTRSNCSRHAAHTWPLLLEISADSYNDQFMIECIVASLAAEQSSMQAFNSILRRYENNARRWHSSGLEEFLSHQKPYSFSHVRDIAELSAQIGDVIRVSKNTPQDAFVAYAFVGDAQDGRIVETEFKPSNASPFTSSLEGFRQFFLRDTKTALTGVWSRGH